MFPALNFLQEKVVPLSDLLQLRIHSSLEIDKILPRLHGIPGILVPFADNLIKMSQGDLGHQRLLDGSPKYSLNTGVTAHFLAYMVQNRHDIVLVPPFRILDAFHFSAHDDDLAGGDKLASSVR